MNLWHTAALAILLSGCSGNALEVTRNDEPWSYQQVTEELHTGTGSTQLQIVLTDPGPPHVADAGGSYSVVVELDPSALEGTLPRTLEVNGAALFHYTDAIPTTRRSGELRGGVLERSADPERVSRRIVLLHRATVRRPPGGHGQPRVGGA